MKKVYLSLVIVIIIGIVWYISAQKSPVTDTKEIITFEDCVKQYGIVMESYPRQCRTDSGKTFVENIGNTLDKVDLIRVTNIVPNQEIAQPVLIEGEARGYWFFEASFPIIVVDWDGKIIGQGFATATDEWMTTDFVPFTANISYDKSQISGQYSDRGTLILQRSNASGLPENDDALELPVLFQ